MSKFKGNGMDTCKIKLVEGFVNKDQSLDDLSLDLFAAVGNIADAIIFKDDISYNIGCAFAIVISIHKLKLYEFSVDSRVAKIIQSEDRFYNKFSEANALAELYKKVGMWAEGSFSVFGGKADRVDEIIYTLMYLANCNNHKLLDCLDDYLAFLGKLEETSIEVDVFKHQKPYALIELSEADSETHVILSGEHYEFKDVRFYVDADLAIDQSEALESNGVKTILLNTHALMSEFYKHEASCLAAQIGIDAVNYDVKQ